MPYRAPYEAVEAEPPAAAEPSADVEELVVLAVIAAAGAAGVGSAVADPTQTTAGAVGMLMLILVVASLFRGVLRSRRH